MLVNLIPIGHCWQITDTRRNILYRGTGHQCEEWLRTSGKVRGVMVPGLEKVLSFQEVRQVFRRGIPKQAEFFTY
jgi:hypothetical protein